MGLFAAAYLRVGGEGGVRHPSDRPHGDGDPLGLCVATHGGSYSTPGTVAGRKTASDS